MMDKKRNQLNIQSTLKDLSMAIAEGRKIGEIKKDCISCRVLGMIGHLSSSRPSKLVPQKMERIGELYSVPQEDFRKFIFYKQKTWLKLEEILTSHGLPQLNLPEEYRLDPYAHLK